jgi:hypothetical protein
VYCAVWVFTFLLIFVPVAIGICFASVAEPHYFDEAPAPDKKKLDAALAPNQATAPTLLTRM